MPRVSSAAKFAETSSIAPQVAKALLKATKRSTHKRHQTGCVIVKKDKILSDGCAHASHFRMNQLHSIHAEIHALGRGRYEKLENATAYICTMARKSGNIVFSAPCLTCAIALRSAGIKEVIYTDGNKYVHLNLDSDLSGLKIYPRRKGV